MLLYVYIGCTDKTKQQHTEMIMECFVCTNSLEITNSLLSEKNTFSRPFWKILF